MSDIKRAIKIAYLLTLVIGIATLVTIVKEFPPIRELSAWTCTLALFYCLAFGFTVGLEIGLETARSEENEKHG